MERLAKALLFSIIALCMVAGLAHTALAQSANDGFRVLPNNDVRVIALQPDGKVLISGAFTSISSIAHSRIARLDSNGHLDATFGTNLNNIVSKILVQADGKIVIVGSFTTVDSVTRNYIARLNSDGSLDTDFDPNVSSTINTAALQPDGKILIGGIFSTVGGSTRYHLARLNTDGSLDTAFNTLGTESTTSITSAVEDIVLQPDGKIIVSGGFSGVGSTTCSKVARLNSDGSLDTSFTSSFTEIDVNKPVIRMALQPDGKIIVSGAFTAVGATTRNYIARLNSDGSLDADFDPNLTTSYLKSIVLQPDGKILIGGHFTAVGGTARNYIARLNSDSTGTLDTSYDPNASASVLGMALQPDGKIIAGGTFTTMAGVSCSRIARIYPDGTLDTNLVANVADNEVTSIAVQPDSKIFIGGSFTTVNGDVARSGLARLNLDSTLDTTMAIKPTATTPIGVSAITMQSNGQVLVGGSFTKLNNVTRNNIGRLNSDGSLDTVWGGAGGMNGLVSSIIVQPDGNILAAGSFSLINNVIPRKSIVRISSTGAGTVDSNFYPKVWYGASSNSSIVNAMALQADGKILIGGQFTNISGVTRNNIARLNTGGGLDTGFDSNVTGGYVYAIAFQPDGKILIGGTFTAVGGYTHNRLARLTDTGAVDDTFTPDVNSDVYSVVVQSDGKILIAGYFTTVNGTTRNYLARLNSDGTLDTSFNPNPNAALRAIALQSDGKILVGGTFTTIGGAARNRLARLTNTGAVVQEITASTYDNATNKVTITWTRQGSGPEFYNALLDYSDDGTTWLTSAITPVTGGWQRTALTVTPGAYKYIRARGFAKAGAFNGSVSIYETIHKFYFYQSALTVAKAGTGTGTVTSSPSGINCGTTCSGNFLDTSEITLNATSSGPSDKFAGWSGDCTGSGDCTVNMSGDRDVTAIFERAIMIKNDDSYTGVASVPLTLSGSGATKMRFMVSTTAWTAWEPYKTSKTVTLPTGDGIKTVYVQFDNDEAIYYDTIVLDTKAPVGSIAVENGAAETNTLSNVDVTLAAEDASTVTEMCVSTTTTCTAWEPFATTKMVTLAGTAGVYGTKTVYAKFKDITGKISTQVSDTIMYVSGIISPTPAYVSIDGGTTYANKTAVTLNISAPIAPFTGLRAASLPVEYTDMRFSTNGTTWTAWEPINIIKQFTLPAGDGEKTVYAMFKNGASEDTTKYADTIILDTKPPVVTKVLINQGAISTNDANITLNLGATDLNDVAKRQVSFDGITWEPEEAYTVSKLMTLSGPDGTKKVFVRVIDKAGNTSAAVSDSILLDTVAPVGTVKINGGATATTNPLVKLTLAAPTAVQMQINADGTWGSWEPFMTAKEVTIPNTADDKTVSVKFRDYTGNDSTASATITMVTPPGTSDGTIVIKNGDPYTTTTSVTLTTINYGTNDQMQFSTNNTTWSAWEGVKPTKTITLPTGDGIKYVLARFRTGPTGAPTAAYSDTIILDTKAPTGAIVINGNAAFTNISTVTVSVNATDANGVAAMNFSLNGITWLGWETYATTKTLTLHAPDGAKKVSVKFKDNAGKESAIITDSITLDRVAPVGKVVINGGAANTSSDIVTLTLTATGATMMQISVDSGSTWGSWETFATSKKVTIPSGAGIKTVKVKFKDAAGNISSEASDNIELL